MQKERKKKWDESHQEAVAAAVKQLDEFDKVLPEYLFKTIEFRFSTVCFVYFSFMYVHTSAYGFQPLL